MKGKFIVNSLLLRKRLKDLDLDIRDKEEEITVTCINGTLIIQGGSPLYVECKEPFSFQATVKQLRKLSKVMGFIEEQPAVIGFDDNRWINIGGIVV